MKIRRIISEGWAARHEPETAANIARGFWVFLLFLLMCMVLFAIAYGTWEFLRPLLGNTSSAVVGSPPSSLERDDLQNILDGFDERVRLFEERQDTPSVADPS